MVTRGQQYLASAFPLEASCLPQEHLGALLMIYMYIWGRGEEEGRRETVREPDLGSSFMQV